MKTVLCFGDSHTYGHDPAGTGRHAHENRWPMVLQHSLRNNDAYIIPEGLSGRTTAFDDHFTVADRNATRILPTLLDSHRPLDLVIFMLGTNDLKAWTGGSAFAASRGLKRLIEMTHNHPWSSNDDMPELLVVSPPHLVETGDDSSMAFLPGLVEQSYMLSTFYSEIADETGCGFFDAASVAKASPLDGVHMDIENTKALGRGLEPIVRVMLGL